MLVRGNRITAVGKPGEVAVGRDARVLPAGGKFLIPGLWDMHVHATGAFIEQAFLPALVANGITGVREMFSRRDWVDSARARIRRGALVGPRIVASGHILDGVPPIWPGSVAVRNAEEARRAVDSLAAGGADFLKVYNRLPRDAYFAAVAEAKARGLPVAGHVPTLISVEEAVDSGQVTIEHLTGLLLACSPREEELRRQLSQAAASPKGWDSVTAVLRAQTRTQAEPFDEAKCRRLAYHLAQRGTWMVPTFAVLRSIAYLDDSTLRADPRLRYVPVQWRASWDPAKDFRFKNLGPADWAARKLVFERQRELARLLHQEKVRFLAGTDLANPYIYPGFSLHDELATLVALGFTPLEALRAATLDPARFLGAGDSLGAVATGKRADLVLLEANPLEDIRNTSRIVAVVADGRLYELPARQRMLAEVEKWAAGR